MFKHVKPQANCKNEKQESDLKAKEAVEEEAKRKKLEEKKRSREGMTEKLKVAKRPLFYGDVKNYEMLDHYDQTQVFQAGPAIIHPEDYVQAKALSALNEPNVFIPIEVQPPKNIVRGIVKPLTTFGKSV